MTEPAAVYDQKTHRARKPYTCGECGTTIQPGDLYHRHAGVWDGEWSVHRLCDPCQNLLEAHNAEWDPPEWGCLHDSLTEWIAWSMPPASKRTETDRILAGRFAAMTRRRAAAK